MSEIVTAETVERAARDLLATRAQQRGLTGDQWDKVGPQVQLEMKEQAHAVLQAAVPAIAEAALDEFYQRVLRDKVPTVEKVREEMERTMFGYSQEQEGDPS